MSSHNGSHGLDRDMYAEAAFRSAMAEVSGAIAGERNNVLHENACGLGRLVGASRLRAEDVQQALLEVAGANGLSRQEAVATIRSGINAGKKRPRHADRIHAGRRNGLKQRRRRKPTTAIGQKAVSPTPPLGEVRELWDNCICVADDIDVSSYLRQRGLSPDKVEDIDLARALPTNCGEVHWAKSWPYYTRRLVFPLFDHAGRMSSLKAHPRNNPKGYSVRGLVLATPLARLLLEGAPCGDGTPVADYVRCTGLVIAEGEIDFLSVATLFSDADQDAPAVLGIHAGAFTQAVAERIPTDTRVAVCPDNDPAGNRYANQIADFLGDRCDVQRLTEKEVHHG